jgi:hypothetical protein
VPESPGLAIPADFGEFTVCEYAGPSYLRNPGRSGFFFFWACVMCKEGRPVPPTTAERNSKRRRKRCLAFEPANLLFLLVSLPIYINYG